MATRRNLNPKPFDDGYSQHTYTHTLSLSHTHTHAPSPSIGRHARHKTQETCHKSASRPKFLQSKRTHSTRCPLPSPPLLSHPLGIRAGERGGGEGRGSPPHMTHMDRLGAPRRRDSVLSRIKTGIIWIYTCTCICIYCTCATVVRRRQRVCDWVRKREAERENEPH
jgi:hypothetical protein